MTASSHVRELVLAKLAGRNIDVVGFMNELLDLAQEVGVIRCSLLAENWLRFDLPNLDFCEVELDACRAKLRMLCARLHALCDAARADQVSPYGGEVVIQKMPTGRIANGESDSGESQQWIARFKNSPAEQEFCVTPVKAELSSSSACVKAPAVR